MLYSGTDPESYITEYTSVYEDTVYGFGVRGSGFGLWCGGQGLGLG